MVKLSSVKEFRFEFVNKLGLSSKAELRQLHLTAVIHYALFDVLFNGGFVWLCHATLSIINKGSSMTYM